MLTAIDTNVISALWSQEPTASRMADLLFQARGAGGLVICAPVRAELLAYPGVSEQFVDQFLHQTGIRIEYHFSEEAWRITGQAFAEYAERRRLSGGNHPRRLLVDFMVGAHALTHADRLLTLDRERYRLAFAGLVMQDNEPIRPE